VQEVTEHSFTQELGLTHAEFFKSLPPAIENRVFTVNNGNCIKIEFDAQKHVVIELGRQQIRRIALLCMPYCEVTFRFLGFSTVGQETFMHRFNLYFRRGGG
jgi:hypothetical protein